VVISNPTCKISVSKILNQLKRFFLIDDVYSEGFAKSVIIQYITTAVVDELASRLHSCGRFSEVYHSHAVSIDTLLPSGPYFFQGRTIHQAWRLYPDELDAFIFSVIPQDLRTPKQ
jgi:hypothetical protein